ncbi:hypothetical protein G9P44_001347 [Scheffersomyces stipitis]|nr:hypothetical protein G9P44_001347 [Scheffersomyces stipitis]
MSSRKRKASDFDSSLNGDDSVSQNQDRIVQHQNQIHLQNGNQNQMHNQSQIQIRIQNNNNSNSSSKNNDQNGNGNVESNETPKLLSCQRCRTRKVKCNFEFPCSSCLKVGAECVRTVNDMRKKRPPANYVSSLEKKVASLSDFFRKLKSLDSLESKKELLDRTELDDLISKDHHHQGTNSPSSSRQSPSAHHEDSVEDRAVYGPTSVYDDNLIRKNSRQKRSEDASTSSASLASSSSIKILNKDPEVLHCLKLFFTWQYPDHNMFIFREAFLIDFFDPKPTSLYCSKILVLSICALGSRMSDIDRIYHKSRSYYNEAKGLLLSSMSRPSITSLQSFLLLAFYDICNGSNSSGWMLSGSAMRMGFDLGFQLNPEVWFVKSKEDLGPLDVDIRSRVYWGCYVADHFISLLLGRPSLLKMSDASIPETTDLPDLEWIDEFTYQGLIRKQNKGHPQMEQSYISNPLNKIINLINISDNMLNDIFTKSDMENDQSNNEDLDLLSRLEKLSEYNFQIVKWRNSLPPDVQWNRQTLHETADNPTFTCIRYYYYILLLCLNRPFVGIVKKKLKNNKGSLSPLTICSEAIEDLYEAIHKFQSVHGFRRVSIFMVYCSILSISVILLTNTSKQLVDEKKDRLQFFMEVLHGGSKTWRLAEKSYNLIKVKLKNRTDESDEVPTSENVKSEQSRFDVSEVEKSIPETKTRPDSYATRAMSLQMHQGPSSDPAVPIGPELKPENTPNVTAIQSQERIPSVIQQPNRFPTMPQPNRTPTASVRNGNLDQFAASSMSIQSNISQDSTRSSSRGNNSPQSVQSQNQSIVESNTDILFDENLDFLGGPPVLMTSDLFNEDWESLFPDYIFNPKN